MRKRLRVRQFCEENSQYSEGSVRWLVFNASKNGLDKFRAIIRVGRRVFIDIENWQSWEDAQSNSNLGA